MNPSENIPAEIGKAIEPLPAEMKEALRYFKRKTDDLLNHFLQQVIATPIPPMIFHYTDGRGLQGVLETGALWLTDIFCLNDPSELRYGCSLHNEFMRATEKAEAQERLAIEEFAANLATKLEHDTPQVANMFVLCFSKAEDDLAQWRAYADNGRGYTLGFDAHIIEQAFVKSGCGYQSFPVCYNDSLLRQMRKKIVDEVRPLITIRQKGMAPEQITTYLDNLLILCGWQALRVALFFKHHAYCNEQEYRFQEGFMTGTVPEIKYRARRNTLVRYKEFNWRSAAPDSLKKIVVGPASSDSEKAHQFAEDCLRRYHLRAVEISCSPIPYRAV